MGVKQFCNLFQGEDKIHVQRYHEIGRAVATIMSDEIFHDVAYKAKKREHLLAGIDEFLDAVTVLPPGKFIFKDFKHGYLELIFLIAVSNP